MTDSADEGAQLARWLGSAAWTVVVALEVGALVIWSGRGFAPPGYVFMRGPIPLVAFEVSILAQASAALILITRRPRNRIGWIIMAFAAITALAAPIFALTAGSQAAQVHAPVAWFAWFGTWFIFPAASMLAALLAFTFPDGHLASPRFRTSLVLIAAAVVLAAIGIGTRPGPLILFPTIVNPVEGIDIGLSKLAYPLLVLLGAAGVGAGVAFVARYSISDHETRLQIRWYVFAGLALAVGYGAFMAALLLLPPFDPLGEAVLTGFFLTLGIPPVAITAAILRYRLYDIDTIISRTFVYGALTAVLAGIYAASIRLFNSIFTAVTGENSDLALVLTTLLLATTFTPIKGRLERIVERRLRPAGDQPLAAHDVDTLLDDPEFSAAFDRRVRAIVAEAARTISSSSASARGQRPLDEAAVTAPTDKASVTEDRLTPK